jgi:hypothetical protein
MKKVAVDSGACGYKAIITAETEDGETIKIKIETECLMVKGMAEELKQVEKYSLFAGFLTNPVYRVASKHVQHCTCPVPSAILKAVEAEAGLNVSKNVSIEFIE